MKSPSLALFNSIGCQNDNQRMLYLASLLLAGLTPSPSVEIRSAVPAITAKPLILASANTNGIAANVRYPGSPAYPANTEVPAVNAVPAITAIKSPVVVPLPGWSDAVSISAIATEVTMMAYLPFSQVGRLFGAPTGNVNSVREITPSALIPTVFMDEVASVIPDNIAALPATVERALYQFALSNPDCIISDEIYNNTLCHKITMIADATNYDPLDKQLQLPKLVATPVGGT